MHEIIVTQQDVETGVTIKIEPWTMIIQGPPAKKVSFNLAEASKYIGVTERHLRDLCLAKKIGFTKPHYREFRFRLPDLETYQERTRTYAKPTD